MTSRAKKCRLQIETLEDRLAPAVAVWDGGSLDSDHWSDNLNWVGDVAPGRGDELVFAAAADQFTAFNDFAAGTGFHSITLEANYELSGNAITLQTAPAAVNLLPNGSFESVPNNFTGQGLLPNDWINTNLFSPNADTYSNDGSYGLPPSGFGNFPGVTAFDGIRWVAGAAFGHLGSETTVGGEAFGTLLMSTLTPGATYRLDAHLEQALRADLAHPGGYQLFLAAGNSGPNLAAATYLGALAPTTGGTWEARSLEFTAPADAGSRPFLVFAPYQVSAGSSNNTYPGLDLVSLTPSGGGGGGDAPPSAFLKARAGSSVISLDILVPPNPVYPTDPIRVIVDGSLELAGVVSGAADLEKLGVGTLVLNAANTFTGKMTVVTGPLSVRNDDALGSSVGITELAAEATLELFGGVRTIDETLSLIMHVGGLPGFPPKFHFGSGGGSNAWHGEIHANQFTDALFEIAADSPLELAGTIDGGTDLKKLGVDSLVLSAANSFTGRLTISDGIVSVANDLALGAVVGDTELELGATLEMFGGVRTIDETLSLIAHSGSGLPGFPPKFHFGSRGGSNAWRGEIHANQFTDALFEIAADSPLELAGTIDGGTDLQKVGVAPLVLSAANSFTSHVTVREGLLSLLNNQALGTATEGTDLVEGAALELVGGVIIAHEPVDVGRLPPTGPGFPVPHFSFGSRGGQNVWGGPMTLWCDECLTSITADSSLEMAGAIGGPGSLEKRGTASLVLSAANTFSGQIVVAEGTLSVRDDLALGSTTGGTELIPGATLELFGGVFVADESLTVVEIAYPTDPTRLMSAGGNNVWTGAISVPFDPEIVVAAGSTLELAGPISGAEDIQKLGGGTLVLSGDSPDYTGTIQIVAGSVMLTGSMPNAGVELAGGTLTGPGTLGSVTVHGTTAADVIRIEQAGDNGAVEVVVNGVSQGRFHPAQRLVVRAGAGDDDVQAAGNFGLSVWLDGEAGNDRLKGGSGDDVLLGGDGNDLLQGGSGRDLMIGGRSADRLIGNADDDILIAGFTAFDDNEAALLAVLTEWTSTRSYEARVANLRGDATNPEFANRLNGNFFLKAGGPTATVFDDGAEDLLTGSSGRDWFFADAGDKITDEKANEFAD